MGINFYVWWKEMNDLISRQEAIDKLCELYEYQRDIDPTEAADLVRQGIYLAEKKIEQLPSAQLTLYGYDIEHLKLIARILQKENLPPERVVEALTDISRIITIVKDEFEETLRKAAEQWKS